MEQFLNKSDSNFSSSRLLISGMEGKDMLLSTDLLRWYLEQGLIITAISEVIEFRRAKPFTNFAKTVTGARKAGALDPSKKILADTEKVTGNSG